MWMLQKLNILNMDVDVDGTSKTITNIQKKLDTGVWIRVMFLLFFEKNTNVKMNSTLIYLEFHIIDYFR